MPILQQYLFAIGSFQGLLLAGLLMFGSTLSNASRILGLWCLLLALGFLGRFISMDGEINAFSALLGLNHFLPAAFGPLLYLYCRHALLDRPFATIDGWHFSPLLLCYLLNIDILFASPQAKLELILSGPPQGVSYEISNIILFLQAFIYLGYSVALIRKYQQQARQTLASFNPGVFSWLWKLLILDATIWILKFVETVIIDGSILYAIADGLIIVLIYSIAMAQWRNPTLFKIEQLGLEPAIEPTTSSSTGSPPDTNNDTATTNEIKSSGALDASTQHNFLQTVKQHMCEQRSYLDSQLTLTGLATTVGISRHHLSETLNQQEGKNFYQFVNQYRIEYICEQLQQDQAIKILDLAMNAGFSSKSTFNAVFKQFTGRTPSQYRRELIES